MERDRNLLIELRAEEARVSQKIRRSRAAGTTREQRRPLQIRKRELREAWSEPEKRLREVDERAHRMWLASLSEKERQEYEELVKSSSDACRTEVELVFVTGLTGKQEEERKRKMRERRAVWEGRQERVDQFEAAHGHPPSVMPPWNSPVPETEDGTSS